jgi:hypothetical protein
MLPFILFLLIMPLLKTMINFNINYLDLAFWPLAALTLVLSLQKVTTKSLDVFMAFLLGYSLITNVIELFMFIAFRRLPAQGYPNSIVVRFGAWLDAPNDFACILFLLMGWSYYRYQGARRVLIEVSLMVCLILTQSLTAYVFFMLLLVVAGIRCATKSYRSMLWVAAATMLVVALVLWESARDLVTALLLSKSGSINGHLFPIKEWINSWSSWIILGNFSYQFYENWYASSLVNFGVIWFAVCILALSGLLFSVVAKFRGATEMTDKAVMCGFMLFSVYCVVGSINLPLLMLFPINFLFYVFGFLVLFGKLEGRHAHGNTFRVDARG